uniref:Uncharacterized protein n=1 Tax=Ditylenchus dipsaci TaxID=166011 RepID=A0A915ELN3_9BILA
MSCGITNPYMGRKAEKGERYEPTHLEHVANTISHAIAILPSLLVTKELIASAHRDLQYNIALIYGFFTTLLFLMSTIYHLKLRYYLHITDRVTIYFFIAASSTPWLTLRNCDHLGINLKWMVWAFAILGIIYQINFHEGSTIATMNDRTGVPLMLLGGLVYLVGMVFFKLDGVVPFAHTIWHLHVVLGASIHTYTVYSTLFGPDKLNPFPDVDFAEPI